MQSISFGLATHSLCFAFKISGELQHLSRALLPKEGQQLMYAQLQQYVVDAWASTEQSELNWIRHHQKELRSDLYQDLRNAANDGADAANQGKRIILPSTHMGSPRHMYQLFQDSMAICRHCRKPDLFLTL